MREKLQNVALILGYDDNNIHTKKSGVASLSLFLFVDKEVSSELMIVH